MGVNKRPALSREQRRQRVAELYLRGATQQDIANSLGCGQATVSRDLDAVVKRWQKEALQDIDAMRSAELERINLLEREYWAAWERSRETATESTARVVTDGDVQKKTASKTEKERDGDPRWLAGVMTCIERRCKLLGVDAPERHEHQVRHDPFEGLADGEVARLAAHADRTLKVLNGGA